MEEARVRSGEGVPDELAALLFCLTRRPRALRAGWERVPLVLVANHALACGFVIDCDVQNVELSNLRLRVVTGKTTFEDVRAWVAAHLQRR